MAAAALSRTAAASGAGAPAHAAAAPSTDADGASGLVEIERRVGRLEKSVGPARVAELDANKAGADELKTIVAEVKEIYDRVQQVNDQPFLDFMRRYYELEHFLASDKALKELLSTQEMKKRIILFGFDDFRRIAALLDAMRKLTVHLDKPPFDNLVTTQRKLGLLETSALTLTDQVYQVHDRVESMLDTYSKAMETLNEEVLGYHELITQWESVVDAALRKQGLA